MFSFGVLYRKHYLNEARNMWRVEKSPNVLQLLEAWEQKGKIYMRMELCKLGSLKLALLSQKKYGGFDERRTWKCLADLASGMRAIHDSNIIHLDIKPENVFVTSAGSLKIGDFGLSITYPVETKDIIEGDKYYVAQELLNGQCGKFSDIFSLGMTIFEIVTNRPGDLPGEGPQWHYLRDGNFDMDDYMAKGTESTLSSTAGPSSKQPRENLLASLPAELTASPLLAEASDMLAEDLTFTPPIKELGTHKLFSGDLLDLMKEMMQPAFEQRPAAAAIMKCPAIQEIVAKRSEQGSRGTRSDEAMNGLLLQSV
ncbi:kinase-like domain-containing protein [Dissophora ornata]|nr:kinase-like domain-containing protein [Dissophora ornata]